MHAVISLVYDSNVFANPLPAVVNNNAPGIVAINVLCYIE